MPDIPAIAYFWFMGLVGIGLVVLLLSKAAKSSEVASGIAIWGAVLASGWIFYGGLIVMLSFK